MICKNCKAKIPEESKYCEKCGLKIERDRDNRLVELPSF